jgi:hypothetical protein
MASVIGYSAPINLKALPATSSLNDTDLVLIQVGGQLQAITKADLASALGGGTLVSATVNQARAQTDTIYSTFSCPNGVDVPIPNLAVTITPNSTNSIITLNLNLCGEWSVTSNPNNSMVSIRRAISDGTTQTIRNANSGAIGSNQGIQPFMINYFANASSTMESCNINFTDDLGLQTLTSSSTVTYTPILTLKQTTGIFYLNRTVVFPNTAGTEAGISTFHAVDNVNTLTFSS